MCVPAIPVVVRTADGYLTQGFLVDTGAEVSVAPRNLARAIGLIWEELPSVDASGVGPGSIEARVGRIAMRIGPVDLTIRCIFTDTPLFLLGRLDFLDRFRVTIDTRAQRIVLDDYS